MTNFERLNKETYNYNNGISRQICWSDYAKTNTPKKTEKKGRYLGNGQYVED